MLAIAAEGGGIDEAFVFRCRRRAGLGCCACPAVAHVDRGLLFAGEALHEVVVAGALDGHRPTGGVLQRIEIVLHLVRIRSCFR